MAQGLNAPMAQGLNAPTVQWLEASAASMAQGLDGLNGSMALWLMPLGLDGPMAQGLSSLNGSGPRRPQWLKASMASVA